MKIRLLYISIAVVFLTLYNSCKKETSINSTDGLRKNLSKITYAKGFDIQYFTTYKKLIIKKPYPDASTHPDQLRVSSVQLIISLALHLQLP